MVVGISPQARLGDGTALLLLQHPLKADLAP